MYFYIHMDPITTTIPFEVEDISSTLKSNSQKVFLNLILTDIFFLIQSDILKKVLK